MQIKHVVLCYVQHKYGNPTLRKEVEFPDEPTYKQIEEVLSNVELSKSIDTEIDYASGAVLPDYRMPRKSKVLRIYATVEKRFYKEVEKA